jgi:hypothetical protein
MLVAFVILEDFEGIVEIIVLYHGCQVYRSGSILQHHRLINVPAGTFPVIYYYTVLPLSSTPAT